MYYLDKAPFFKEQIEKLDFTEQQLNLVAKMMLGCRALRQRNPIINLMRCSLPEKFELELIKEESQDKTRSWENPLIVLKKAEVVQ